MNIKVLKNVSLQNFIESKWINLNVEKLSSNSVRMKARSIQIIWQDLIAGYDGVLKLYMSNELNAKSLERTINVNSASNINNTELFILESEFRLLKFEYIKNSNVGGSLDVSINYY